MPPYAKRIVDGLVLTVRLTPNASRDKIPGVDTRKGATPALKVRVRAVPEKGRANAALAALLAKHLGLPKRAVEVISGHTARQKQVLLKGDPTVLEAGVSRMLENSSGRK